MLCVLPVLVCSTARAEEWTLESQSGEVTQQKNGDWRPLTADDKLCGGAEIKVGKEGSLVISGETSIVAALANSDFKCASTQGVSVVNVEAGAVGVQSLPGKVDQIEVRSRYIDANAKGADFVVNADAKLSTVVVKSGVVAVRDLLRQKDVQVTAGQALKFGEAAPATDGTAGDGATSQFQAQINAALADRKAAQAADKDTPAAKPSGVTDAALDKALKDFKKAGVKKTKLDPAAAADAAKMAGNLAGTILDTTDDDPEKKANLALPLLIYLFDNDATSLTLIWMVVGALALTLGYVVNTGAREAAFGTWGNMLVLMVGVVLGAFIRDEFFFNGFWYQFEPYVSMMVLLVASFAFLLAAMVGKYKLETRSANAKAKKPQVRVVFRDPSRSRTV
jgi:hypothetical protein